MPIYLKNLFLQTLKNQSTNTGKMPTSSFILVLLLIFVIYTQKVKTNHLTLGTHKSTKQQAPTESK